MARAPRRKPQQSQASKREGQIRIISGQWRGRRLPVPELEGLRPTTDRVRETLFNWLMGELQGARILDCFSGSGALAFESLSRYAGFATLMERDAKVASGLQRNLKSLGATQAEVCQGDTLAQLERPASAPYDLVFVDPPFRQSLLAPCLERLEQNGYLTPSAWIYVESEKELAMSAVPASWRLHREKIAGQVAYRLYQRTFNENS
ncbi:16S rRNA (guanine(966)-N(2))-methyltransferase RsmD [Ferrimonas marina]|uniref:Ribosomal RNA small subunit methyltransferase D n=1 Tax=Ferrimonas marina TaxID=299255 RepID=A0A1M5XNT8_9GAMM|nr:16S rRNA (guanine(966)-N(2))-methyltransferase RsmD [Ferrimonas marina]SHI01480.1 16S rRNA (guanine966-N2)-methyltransferase [Ferrimonas marina]